MNCHLSYISPPELYAFSYRVTWPRFNLETQATEVHVISGDGAESSKTKQTTQQTYLTVSHDTVVDVVDGEIVLQGRKEPHHSTYAFTVHSLKQPADFTGTNPKDHIQLDRRTNTQSMTFQTSAPFAINRLVYSGRQSEPSPDQSDHSCPLDVGDVYARQAIYSQEAMNVDVDVQDEVTGRIFNIIPWIKPTVTFNLTGEWSGNCLLTWEYFY
jgi:hypothetical protein